MKKLDLIGALAGTILSIIIWIGAGEIALLALFVFFILGIIATSWKKELKSKLNLIGDINEKRGIYNVLANGGVAGIFSMHSIFFQSNQTSVTLIVLSVFACACSDTLSSELGSIYGRKYFNIITFKPDHRGKDGVISPAGLVFGLIGSATIAILTTLLSMPVVYFFIVAISGIAGNLIDSVLGATLQQRNILSNHGVNFFATLFAAILCLLLLELVKIS